MQHHPPKYIMISLGIWNSKTRVDLYQKWWTSSNPSRLGATQSVSSSCHAFVWSLQSGFSNLDYFGWLLEGTLGIGMTNNLETFWRSQICWLQVKLITTPWKTHMETHLPEEMSMVLHSNQSFQSFWGGFLCDYLWLWCLAYAASVLSGWTHLHQICQQ